MTDLQPIIPGAPHPLVIAGPCSAESPEQLAAVAEPLAALGIRVFRAGIWKPRTSPGSFEGVGAVGLPWLREAAQANGMLSATEVATAAHVEAALAEGIDVLWIGARTSANPFAVQEIADTLSRLGRTDAAVLVKNSLSPDLDLWAGALQRLYNAGVRRIGAVHRGFTAYAPQLFRNPPHWNVAVALKLRYPNLPVVCDPSHIAGRRDLIAGISQEALDMGMDGLMIEAHCDPDKAWSDAAQQLTPAALGRMLRSLHVRTKPCQEAPLASLREEIDRIDEEILDALARRMAVSRQIGKLKGRLGMPVVQPGRYNDVMHTRMANAENLGISTDALKSIWLAIHDESVRQQLDDTSNSAHGIKTNR